MIANYKPSTRIAALASALLLIALGALTFTRAANKPARTPPAGVEKGLAETHIESTAADIPNDLGSEMDETRSRLAYYRLRLDLLKERGIQAGDIVKLRQATEDFHNAEALLEGHAISSNQFNHLKSNMETLAATVGERSYLLSNLDTALNHFDFRKLAANGPAGSAAITPGPAIAQPPDPVASKRQIEILQRMLDEEESSIRTKQEKLDRMRLDFGISQADENQAGAAGTSEALRKLQSLRLEAQAEHEKLNRLYQHLAGLNRAELKKALATASPDAQLSSLQDALATAQQKRAALSANYAAEHPDVRTVTALIDTISKQIEDRLDGILEGLKARALSSKAALDQLQAELEKARKLDIEATISRQPYFQAKRDLEIMQQTREQLLTRLNQIRIDAAIPK